MEIERKWMVTGWPAGLEQTSVYNMDQAHQCAPTVRIRAEALQAGARRWCSASRARAA